MEKFLQFTKDQVKEFAEMMKSKQMDTVIAKFKEQFEKDPEKFGTFKIIITTEDEDRGGDVVAISGWELEDYKANPVVLWAHSYNELPVGVTTSLTVEGDKIIAEGFFAPEEANPHAQKVRKLYELGFMNAASVGFIPKEFDAEDENRIIKQELLEWSFVPVPANAKALNLLKKSGFRLKDRKELVAKGLLKEVVEEKKEKKDVVVKADKATLKEAQKTIGNLLSKLNTDISNMLTATFESITNTLSIITANDEQPEDAKAVVDQFKLKAAIEGLENLKGVMDSILVSEKDAVVVNQSDVEPVVRISTNLTDKQVEKEVVKLLKLINSVTSEGLNRYKKRHDK